MTTQAPPDTRSELRYFAALCAGSGVAEELVYRGFLMFLIAYYAPHLTNGMAVLIVSAVFGLGHVYQGWRGVTSTGLSGLILTILYVASGSILLPAVIHSAGNLQVVVILWPPSTESRVAFSIDCGIPRQDVEQTDGEPLPAPSEAAGDPGAKTTALRTAILGHGIAFESVAHCGTSPSDVDEVAAHTLIASFL